MGNLILFNWPFVHSNLFNWLCSKSDCCSDRPPMNRMNRAKKNKLTSSLTEKNLIFSKAGVAKMAKHHPYGLYFLAFHAFQWLNTKSIRRWRFLSAKTTVQWHKFIQCQYIAATWNSSHHWITLISFRERQVPHYGPLNSKIQCPQPKIGFKS